MAGTYRIKAEVDTSQALAALGGLRTTILGIGTALASAFTLRELTTVAGKFQDLRTTLNTLYRDTQVGSAVFDDIKKFAAESVFSVEDLTETVVKLKAAGLEPTVALLRLFADTSSVAADSVGALQAITDLYARTTAGGLGLEDLNRLADRGIPVFTILQEKLGLSRLELSKFGQSAEGAQIILKALEQGLQEAFGGASAARLGTLNQALNNLKDSINNAFDTVGMSGFNDALAESVKKLADFISVNKDLAAALGQVLSKAISFVVDNIEILTKASIAFFAIMSVQAIYKITQAMAIFGNVVGKNPIVKLLVGLGTFLGTYAAVDVALDTLSKDFEKLNQSTDNTTKGFKALKEGSVGTVENLKGQVAALNEESAKQVRELQKIGSEYKRNLDYMIDAVEREKQMFGTTVARQRIIDETAKVERSTREALIQLDERYNSLDKKARAERKADYEKEREQIIQNGAAAKTALETQITLVENLRRVYDDLTKAYEILGTGAEKIFREQVDLALETNAGWREQIEITQKLNDLLQVRQLLLSNLNNISAAERSVALEILNETILSTKTLNLTYDQQISKIREAVSLAVKQGRISQDAGDEIMKGAENQIRAIGMVGQAMTDHATKMAEQRRSWSFGWSKALRDYTDEATNAAKKADQIFKRFTQGMEDTIVNFAKTGRLEFKSMINGILEDLLRSQIQGVLAQIFSMGGGKSGGGSNAGSILGSLFGGFFATGGMIPPGRFGVVGERGPELVQGPAEVSPLGAQQVIYNISAVDARSFKELIAQDPSFIHAVASQGARGIPGRR